MHREGVLPGVHKELSCCNSDQGIVGRCEEERFEFIDTPSSTAANRIPPSQSDSRGSRSNFGKQRLRIAMF